MSLFSFWQKTLAQGFQPLPPPQLPSPFPPGATETISWLYIASRVVEALLYLSAVLAVIGIIVGGYIYLTSAGNPDAMAKGKLAVLGSVIGLVIILGAWAMVNFFLSRVFF